MSLPSHPESDDTTAAESTTDGSKVTLALFVILGTVFLVIVILHLTGAVGPGAH